MRLRTWLPHLTLKSKGRFRGRSEGRTGGHGEGGWEDGLHEEGEDWKEGWQAPVGGSGEEQEQLAETVEWA